MKNYVKAAKIDDISTGCSKSVEVNGQQIALFNIDGQFFALANNCNHKGGPLSQGSVDGDKVTCPWHGAEFDIKTGANLKPPAVMPAQKFNVRVVDGDIEVEI